MIPDRKPLEPALAEQSLASIFELAPETSRVLAKLGIATVGELVTLREIDIVRAADAIDPELKGPVLWELKELLARSGLRLARGTPCRVAVEPERPARPPLRQGMVERTLGELSVRCFFLSQEAEPSHWVESNRATWVVDGFSVFLQVLPVSPEQRDVESIVGPFEVEATVVKGEWGALVEARNLQFKGELEVTFYDAALAVRVIVTVRDPSGVGREGPAELRALARELALSLAPA